jgi:hypothetical protein
MTKDLAPQTDSNAGGAMSEKALPLSGKSRERRRRHVGLSACSPTAAPVHRRVATREAARRGTHPGSPLLWLLCSGSRLAAEH